MNSLPSIVFATNNLHKLSEVKAMLGDKYNVLSLSDIDCHEDIPETAMTLEGNALQKARFVKERYGYDCFADDTGLEVDVLDGAPGVYSARYAGPGHDSEANMKLLLKNLEGKKERKAHFRTVIALLLNGEEIIVDGRVDGEIIESPKGKNGFGYDPIFVPDGEERSFAEMTDVEKNSMSHRRRAVETLIEKLNTLK